MTDFATLRQRKTEMIKLATAHCIAYSDAQHILFARWMIQAGKWSDQPPCSVLVRPARVLDWK